MRVLRLIFIFLAVFISAPLTAGPLPTDFLIIEHLDIKREKNGQTSQAFRLAGSDQGMDALNVFYRVNPDNTVYQTQVTDSEFTIFVDRPSFIHISAVARTKQIFYVAKTDIALFGRSKTAPGRFASNQKETELPFIELTRPKHYYWPQTGQTFRFHVNAPFDPGVVDLSVLVNGQIHNLIQDRQPEFTYIPAHDPHLRRASALATRRDILFASISDGSSEYRLTYSLPLHRSRQAFKNRSTGWAVFGFSFLFFCGLILIKRRKSPWWKEPD